MNTLRISKSVPIRKKFEYVTPQVIIDLSLKAKLIVGVGTKPKEIKASTI